MPTILLFLPGSRVHLHAPQKCKDVSLAIYCRLFVKSNNMAKDTSLHFSRRPPPPPYLCLTTAVHVFNQSHVSWSTVFSQMLLHTTRVRILFQRTSCCNGMRDSNTVVHVRFSASHIDKCEWVGSDQLPGRG